jgi:hypothetical protein
MRRLALLLLAAAACKTVANPLYCEAMSDCADVSGRPFCDLAGEFDLKNTCVADPSVCSIALPCEIAGLPACVDGVCQECDDRADCTGHAGMPACGAAHVCVECTENTDCPGARPFCDVGAEMCRGCAADDECATGACNKATGVCHLESDLVFVATNGGGTACTRQAPCGSMLAGLNAVIGSRDVILASGTYNEPLDVVDFDVTIKGPVTISSPSAAALRVMGNRPVRLENVTFTDGSQGLTCTGSGGRASLHLEQVVVGTGPNVGLSLDTCDAVLDRTRIAGRSGLGINTTAASLTIRRSEIVSNTGGGIRVATTDYDIENTFIVKNGTDGTTGSDVGGIRFTTDAPGGLAKSRFEFNTVAYNVADDMAKEGVHCDLTGQVNFGNNIVVGVNADAVDPAANCKWRYSAFTITVGSGGDNNLSGNPAFEDDASNYHLSNRSPCRNAADPGATVTVDFDGQPRPVGGRADIGADEFQ